MELRPEDITPELLSWLTPVDAIVDKYGEQLREKLGDRYGELVDAALDEQVQRQDQYLGARRRLGEALAESRDEKEYGRTFLEVSKSVNPDVAERLASDFKDDLLAIEAYRNLRDRFKMNYGDPERAIEEYRARGAMMSEPVAATLAGMSDFGGFTRRLKQALAADRSTRQDDDEYERAMRVAETATDFGIGLDYLRGDPAAAVEIGFGRQDRLRAQVDEFLKHNPEIAGVVQAQPEAFEQYIGARNYYLSMAAQEDRLAKQAVESGSFATFREAKEAVRQGLKDAYDQLLGMKEKLPDTTVRDQTPEAPRPSGAKGLDYANVTGPGDYDPLEVPPAPADIPKGFAGNTVNSVIRGVTRIGDAFREDVAAANALRFPTQDDPNARVAHIIPANWETFAADFGEFGIAMAPQFAVGGGIGAAVAGGVKSAALRGAAEAGIAVGVGEALTPRPGDVGDYATRVAGGAAAGAVGGALVGAAVGRIGKAFAAASEKKAAIAREADIPLEREALRRMSPERPDAPRIPDVGKKGEVSREIPLSRTPDEIAALEQQIVARVERLERGAGEKLPDGDREAIRQFVKDSAAAGEPDEAILRDADVILKDALGEQAKASAERARTDGTTLPPRREPTRPEPKLGPRAKKIRQENAAKRKARLKSKGGKVAEETAPESPRDRGLKSEAEIRAESDAVAKERRRLEGEGGDADAGGDLASKYDSKMEVEYKNRIRSAAKERAIKASEARADEAVARAERDLEVKVDEAERKNISNYIREAHDSGESPESVRFGVQRLVDSAVRRSQRRRDYGIEPPKTRLRPKKKGGAANPPEASGVEMAPVEGGPARVVEAARRKGKVGKDRSDRVTVAPLRHEDPQFTPRKTSDILKDLSSLFSRKLGFNRRFKRRLLGHYDPKTGETAIVRSQDVPVAIHELTHSLTYDRPILKRLEKYQDELLNSYFMHTVSPERAKVDPSHIYKEGFSEFVKAYFLDPRGAKSRAPQLFKAFEESMGEGWVKSARALSDDIRYQAGSDWRMGSNILRVGERSAMRSPEDLGGWERIMRNMIDKSHPATTVFAERAVGGRKMVAKLRPSENPDVLYSRVLGRLGTTTEHLLKGIADRSERVIMDGGEPITISRLFRELAKPAGNKRGKIKGKEISYDELMQRLDDAMAFMLSERTLEKSKPGKVFSGATAGMGDEYQAALKHVLKLRREDPEYAAVLSEAARLYRRMSGNVLRNLRDSGLISNALFKQIRDENLYYLAMNRIAEFSPGEVLSGRVSIQKGISGDSGILARAQADLWKLSQSDRRIANPLESLMRATFNNETAMGANDFRLALRNLALGKTSVQQEASLGRSHLANLARQVGEGDNYTTVIWVDGKPEYWQFAKPFHDALTGIFDEGRAASFLRLNAKFVRFTVTHMPEFVYNNLLRDTIERTVKTAARGGPFGIVPRGWSKLFRHVPAEVASDLNRWGGAHSGWYFKDPSTYGKFLKNAMQEAAGDAAVMHPKGSIRRALRRVNRMIEWSESRTRRWDFWATREHYMKKGMSEKDANLQAMHESRALMDFGRAGRALEQALQTVPFVRAGIAGQRSLWRSMQRNPVGTTAYMTTWSLAAYGAVYHWNRMMGEKAGKLYDELPRWQKDMFLNFYVGAGPVRWVRVPKGYDIAFMSAIIERTIDAKRGKEDAMEGAWGVLLRTVLPVDFRAMGGPFVAMFEAGANYDMWIGKNIVAPWENEKMPGLRDWEGRPPVLIEKTYDWLMVYDWFAEHKGPFDDPRKLNQFLTATLTSMYKVPTEIGEVALGRLPAADLLRRTGPLRSAPIYPDSFSRAMDLSQSLGRSRDRDVKHLREMAKKAREIRDQDARERAFLELAEESQRVLSRLRGVRDSLREERKRERGRR